MKHKKEINISSSMQKHDVINAIISLYGHKAPIHEQGVEVLCRRAENRGYQARIIFHGLATCIKKNFIREEYIPPNNDPMCEVLDDRRLIEDWEFRKIFKERVAQ